MARLGHGSGACILVEDSKDRPANLVLHDPGHDRIFGGFVDEAAPLAVDIDQPARDEDFEIAIETGRGQQQPAIVTGNIRADFLAHQQAIASAGLGGYGPSRSEEHTSELQSLMRISYAVFCLKKKKTNHNNDNEEH